MRLPHEIKRRRRVVNGVEQILCDTHFDDEATDRYGIVYLGSTLTNPSRWRSWRGVRPSWSEIYREMTADEKCKRDERLHGEWKDRKLVRTLLAIVTGSGYGEAEIVESNSHMPAWPSLGAAWLSSSLPFPYVRAQGIRFTVRSWNAYDHQTTAIVSSCADAAGPRELP